MKIRSKFKDYYDYIGHRYGEDPEVVYVRGKLPVTKDMRLDTKHQRFSFSKDDVASRTMYELELVVAGSMVFPVVKMTRRMDSTISKDIPYWVSIDYRQLDPPTLHWIDGRTYEKTERTWQRFQEWLEDTGTKKNIKDIMVKLGAPVYLVRPSQTQEISEHTPILKDYGIASLVGPEMMWQNIYATITNVLRKNPDKDVPVTLKDKDKIAKAGFDLKTSFRHPVNQKKPRKK